MFIHFSFSRNLQFLREWTDRSSLNLNNYSFEEREREKKRSYERETFYWTRSTIFYV